MAIPKFEEFLYPFLLILKEGNITKSQMIERLTKYFNLSQEDLQLTTRGGNTSQLNDRMGWTLQYFRRALFVDIPSKGTYQITQRGLDFLKSHSSLVPNDLLQYPEFSAFSKKAVKISEEGENNTSISEVLTPTDQLEQAFDSINNDLAADLLRKTLDQSPSFFEHLVVDLLVKMGYGGSFANSAKVTQYVHDNGIDGIIYEDKLGLDKIYIQAKRYEPGNNIGKPQIQQFAGALDEQKATKGVFITTSSYSKDARTYVDNLSKKIVLIDGEELTRYMIEYNVGVSTKRVYEVKRLDSDYFEE